MATKNQIISHLYVSNDDGNYVIQTNEEHQKGVATIASKFAKEFGLSSWGYTLGMLHDKGKERTAFQQYIRLANNIPVSERKYYENHQHAFVGGIIAKNLMGKDILNLLANPIVSHHTGLHDWIDLENILEEKQIPEEINTANINIDTALLYNEFLASPFIQNKVEMKHLHHLSRMLFSCLTDADRLDTEQFMDRASWQKHGCSATLANLLPLLEAYIQTLQSNAADTEVNRIRKKVMEQCDKMSAGERGFYSLTVPTGGGKTLSSLVWAMKHAIRHGMNRIIIAIPYTSIIVQTAGILKRIFGEENVLEHHSNFNPDEIKDEEKREKAKLATDNWDYPIIVTTNVQLFESMFSNKPSACRKLHNIANAVILLDEVQTLPIGFLQPIVDAMKAYQKLFGVSILFTTASQPVLNGLIKGTNPREDFVGIEHITEIIPPEFALHEKLRRVELKIDNTGKTYDEIAATLSRYPKVLCIVNTRKDAKELYDRLPDSELKIHLSRMMCPAHIGETIHHIKQILGDESQPVIRVIATQLVEAGVDIDFPVVFRQEAGLDSILQAAGRCNREGKNKTGQTFVFSLSAEGRVPYGAIRTANNARISLPVHSDWFAPSTMKAYFLQLYSRETFDKKGIKDYLYKHDEINFKQASEAFKLIDDDSISVIVPWKSSMDLAVQLKEEGCTFSLMKQLAQYTVGVRRSDFKKLNEYGAIEEALAGIYVLSDRAQYDKDTGISLDNHWMEEVLMA